MGVLKMLALNLFKEINGLWNKICRYFNGLAIEVMPLGTS